MYEHDYDFLTHQQIKALLLQCGIEEATFFNQVQLDMENWFKENPELKKKIDNWRKSLLPKDPAHYRTKRQENVNLKEVDKHDTKLKLKEDWYNKFIKKD